MLKAADRQLYTLRTDVNAAGRKRWKRAWIASWAAYAAANVARRQVFAGQDGGEPLPAKC